jgi:hypothetical protein
VAELNGLPFLDDAFTGSRLLAMTAALRHAAARQRLLADAIVPGDAEAWLAPALAFGLSTSSTPMPALPLTAARRQMIADVLATLAGQLPQWTLLLGLPVRYARLCPSRGAISASSHDWPQHVLLADEAFATSRELREQLLHELAHQWLYLIEDIWPLEVPGAGTRADHRPGRLDRDRHGRPRRLCPKGRAALPGTPLRVSTWPADAPRAVPRVDEYARRR